MKTKQETNEFSYEIDYELFTTEEIIKIINFYNLVIKYSKKRASYEELIKGYKAYRLIINSIALEKKYDKAFYKKTGLSIYHLVNKN